MSRQFGSDWANDKIFFQGSMNGEYNGVVTR
jgi:hypothetical protein